MLHGVGLLFRERGVGRPWSIAEDVFKDFVGKLVSGNTERTWLASVNDATLTMLSE
jgi:hypothetical protein